MKDILASTVMVGGGSLVNILCGIVRSKVISVTVGPAGIGFQGLLQSTLRTAVSVANMSLQTSGVREVARLRAEQNTSELGHTLRALLLGTSTLGGLAALILLLFQGPLAGVVLDDPARGWTLAILGIGVFAQVIYAAYDAFLRGFRRIAQLTKASVLSNVMAAVIGSALVLQFGTAGIVWALVAQPLTTLLLAVIVGRDIRQHLVPAVEGRTRRALMKILGTGVVLAVTALLGTGTQLAARVLVTRYASLDDTGYFQAASAVSILYLGFVLGALSADYYPRLAEAGSDRAVLKRMVNEQARVSVLLAGPVVLGVLALSGPVVSLLYTAKFAVTADLLRWQLLGDVLKVGSWTLGYLVLAQGRPRVYFLTELSWNAAYLIALVVLLPTLGVQATAAAYVIASALYFIVLCIVTNRLAGFTWSRENILLMVGLTLLALVVLGAHLFLQRWPGLIVGCVTTALFGAFCLYRLVHEAGFVRKFRRSKAGPR